MSLSNILLIPGAGQMSFRDALSIFSPYSPRLAANYMDPTGSLYTDASRTTQVTTLGNRIRSFTNFVTGQPHGSASSDAKSPLWNSFTVNGRTVRGAVFDGLDDCLQVAGFDLSNTDEVCVIAGVRKLSDAATGFVCELGNGVSTNGTFGLTAPSSGGANSYRFASEGTTGRAAGTGIFAAAPDSAHLVGIGDISAPLVRLWRNGSIVESVVLSQGTGNFTNATLNIGQRNASLLPFNGAISYLFVLGAIPPDDVLNRVGRGLGPQIGVSV